MLEASFMAAVIAFISQKGGVGKSTLARALAREAAASELSVKIADLDKDQATCIDWQKIRTQRGIEPRMSVELYGKVSDAIAAGRAHDLLVMDGPAMASSGTTEIAKRAHIVVQPTGAGLDDLQPAIRVFHGLVKAGIPASKLVFALNHIGTDAEADAARAYIQEAGYAVLPGYLPERPGYRMAQNEGLAITETRFASLKKQADTLIQALIDRVGEATDG
jgi:chromosome partitioning protein